MGYGYHAMPFHRIVGKITGMARPISAKFLSNKSKALMLHGKDDFESLWPPKKKCMWTLKN